MTGTVRRMVYGACNLGQDEPKYNGRYARTEVNLIYLIDGD